MAEATAFLPGTSVVQWGPGDPVGYVQCLPCICPTLLQGAARRGPRGSHPQGQLGGQRGLLEEEQHKNMSGERMSSAPWQAQPTCDHTAPLSEVKGSWKGKWECH